MRNRIIGGAVALALVVTTVNLGLWQLRRHSEKQRLADRVESRIDLEPVGLGELYEESALNGGVGLLGGVGLAGGADGVKQMEYRRVGELGRFFCEQEVFIRNRTLDGRPGYWVFTPFAVLASEGAGSFEEDGIVYASYVYDGIYIVNRGWLPLELAEATVLNNRVGAAIPAIVLPTPEDQLAASPPPRPPCNINVEITGFIRLPISSAAKECESLAPACTFAHPDIRAISSHFLSLEDDPLDIGRDFYIQLDSVQLDGFDLPAEDSPVVLRAPSFDDGNHLSYAVQWFIFSTIIAVGYFLIFWRKAVFVHKGFKHKGGRTPSSD